MIALNFQTFYLPLSLSPLNNIGCEDVMNNHLCLGNLIGNCYFRIIGTEITTFGTILYTNRCYFRTNLLVGLVRK